MGHGGFCANPSLSRLRQSSPVPHPCCHSERSAAESKNLRSAFLSQGWESTNLDLPGAPCLKIETWGTQHSRASDMCNPPKATADPSTPLRSAQDDSSVVVQSSGPDQYVWLLTALGRRARARFHPSSHSMSRAGEQAGAWRRPQLPAASRSSENPISVSAATDRP